MPCPVPWPAVRSSLPHPVAARRSVGKVAPALDSAPEADVGARVRRAVLPCAAAASAWSMTGHRHSAYVGVGPHVPVPTRRRVSAVVSV